MNMRINFKIPIILITINKGNLWLDIEKISIYESIFPRYQFVSMKKDKKIKTNIQSNLSYQQSSNVTLLCEKYFKFANKGILNTKMERN